MPKTTPHRPAVPALVGAVHLTVCAASSAPGRIGRPDYRRRTNLISSSPGRMPPVPPGVGHETALPGVTEFSRVRRVGRGARSLPSHLRPSPCRTSASARVGRHARRRWRRWRAVGERAARDGGGVTWCPCERASAEADRGVVFAPWFVRLVACCPAERCESKFEYLLMRWLLLVRRLPGRHLRFRR